MKQQQQQQRRQYEERKGFQHTSNMDWSSSTASAARIALILTIWPDYIDPTESFRRRVGESPHCAATAII